MILDTAVLVRVAALAVAATLLSAAGQFPTAPIAALALIGSTEPIHASPIPVSVFDGGSAGELGPVAENSDDAAAAPRPTQLATLVAQTIDAHPTAYGDRDCLARAVFYEARGEPLEGQLAVAQVILNRVASGHFASTVCAVINQHGQFSFDRTRTPTDGRDWRTAKAIAAIAATAAWDIVAPKATAFHATRVAASWSTMRKVGTIGNHVFYR